MSEVVLYTALQGLENVSSRSSETFSLCDVAEWLKQLNTAHLCDLTEKQAALGEVVFSPGGVERVRRVWEKQPRGLSGRSARICDETIYYPEVCML